MNFLPKAFLALSLIAVVPATVEARFGWTSIKETVGAFLATAKDAATSERAAKVSAFARNNPKTSAAIGVTTVAGVVGAGYLAKKYHAGSKVANAASASNRLANSAYAKFSALSRKKKAGVVAAGTLGVICAGFLAKVLYDKYNSRS